MNANLFVNYEKAFYVDGSFRDIYVLGTNRQDWQKLLAFLRSGPYSIEFSVDEQLTPLPESVEAIFALRDEHCTCLHIDKKHLALNCFFFACEEIEFGLDPRDFQGDTASQQISRLLDFLHTIGQLLNKTVILIPEGDRAFPLFHFDPETGKDKWFWDHIDKQYQWMQWTSSTDNKANS